MAFVIGGNSKVPTTDRISLSNPWLLPGLPSLPLPLRINIDKCIKLNSPFNGAGFSVAFGLSQKAYTQLREVDPSLSLLFLVRLLSL